MRIRGKRLGVFLGGLGLLAATITFGSGAASAQTMAPGPPSGGYSCWQAIDTGEGLCVDEGIDLVAAVAKQKGVELVVPDGTPIGGIKSDAVRTSALAPSEAMASTVISIIYDNINYGGGSYVMSVSEAGACSFNAYGYPDIGPLGWYGRVSSFRSYAGCRTAVFEGVNYAGSSYGYYTNASSLGAMNDKAKSWRVID